MEIAVIRTGGKQYVVSKGDVLEIEKLEKKDGAKVTFDTLLVHDGKKAEVGTPLLKTKVEGKVLEQGKAKKINVRTYKAKKRQKRAYGHRQPYTKVEIVSLGAKA